MNDTDFKQGDLGVCVTPRPNYFTEGKTYEVSAVSDLYIWPVTADAGRRFA